MAINEKDLEVLIRKFLNLKINEIERIEVSDNKIIIVESKDDEFKCPLCNETLLLNGFYKKKIIIPEGVLSSYLLSHHKRRYRCYKCNKSFSLNDHVASKGHNLSYAAEMKIMDLLVSPKMTFREVSRIMGVSLPTVIRVFDSRCSEKRLPLPPVISVDEVYTKNNDYSNSKFSFLIYDFRKHKVVDVLPSRKKKDLSDYFSSLSEKERNNVLYVCMDMYKTYKDEFKLYFKKATICADSFHVVKHVNDDLSKLRVRIMRKYTTDSIEYYLLKNFNFLLHDRKLDLDNEGKFNHKLGYHINYRGLLEKILEIDEELKTAYYLKEDYLDFNELPNKRLAEERFDIVLNDFIKADIEEYKEFISVLKNWRVEILNSFIRIDGIRISNGIAESLNNTVSTLIYNSRGIRKSERRRKRIMYSVNKTYSLK